MTHRVKLRRTATKRRRRRALREPARGADHDDRRRPHLKRVGSRRKNVLIPVLGRRFSHPLFGLLDRPGLALLRQRRATTSHDGAQRSSTRRETRATRARGFRFGATTCGVDEPAARRWNRANRRNVARTGGQRSAESDVGFPTPHVAPERTCTLPFRRRR
jgi:hypothetical protein